ncbi:MAG: uS2 family ribosomal protein [Candidatus Obscuribacterales bacterium]|nr:uS2 family ribosomal protein [Candidatus Obscuribacterales bacterium]
MAEAYSEKIKASYAEVSPEKVQQLIKKTESLEAEIIDLRQTVKALEEACDFASGLIEAKESQDQGQVLKTKSRSKESTGI